MVFQEQADDAELQSLLQKAIHESKEKVDEPSELLLRKYLPSEDGSSMHHFTWEKMKIKQPKVLIDMLNEHILHKNSPQKAKPKKRATKGSRRSIPNFTREQTEKVLKIGELSGDKQIMDLLYKILPRDFSVKDCARNLIASIRRNECDQKLWEEYIDAVTKYKRKKDSEEIYSKHIY